MKIFSVKYLDTAKLSQDWNKKYLRCTEGAKGEPWYRERPLYFEMKTWYLWKEIMKSWSLWRQKKPDGVDTASASLLFFDFWKRKRNKNSYSFFQHMLFWSSLFRAHLYSYYVNKSAEVDKGEKGEQKNFQYYIYLITVSSYRCM